VIVDRHKDRSRKDEIIAAVFSGDHGEWTGLGSDTIENRSERGGE
jgi:hypothetical protein